MAASEQARLIASLYGKGYTNKQLAALTGRSERYITLARDSQTAVGKGGKVTQGRGQNLIPALRELNEKGKLSPSSIPGRRTTKTGKVANVRKGVKEFTTTKGVKHTRVQVKKGPATLKRAIGQAGKSGSNLRWDIKVKRLVRYPDEPPHEGYISGKAPFGMDSQQLMDRINNPQPGDSWQAGDVNGALFTMAVEQNPTLTLADGPIEYNLYTVD